MQVLTKTSQRYIGYLVLQMILDAGATFGAIVAGGFLGAWAVLLLSAGRGRRASGCAFCLLLHPTERVGGRQARRQGAGWPAVLVLCS